MNLKRVLSFGIVFILLGFFAFNIYQNRIQILTFPWKFDLINIFFLVLTLIPIYLFNTLSWYLVTKALGSKISYQTSLRIWLLSNISRFIPGGVWQYAGRVYLAKREGVSGTIAISSVLIESLFTVAIGVMIALLFLPANLGFQRFGLLPILILGIIVILVFIGLTNGKYFYLISKLTKKLTNKGEVVKDVKIPFEFFPILVLSFAAQFFIDGAVLFFLSRFVIDLSFQQYFLFVGIFAFSWIVGYLTFFAPSGLGVQELSLTFLLSQYMPFPVAGVVAILFRLLLMLSETSTLSTYLFFNRKA